MDQFWPKHRENDLSTSDGQCDPDDPWLLAFSPGAVPLTLNTVGVCDSRDEVTKGTGASNLLSGVTCPGQNQHHIVRTRKHSVERPTWELRLLPTASSNLQPSACPAQEMDPAAPVKPSDDGNHLREPEPEPPAALPPNS